MKIYVEYGEQLNTKNKSKLSRTMFLAKYDSLALYDEGTEKILIIDNEQLKCDKKDCWNLFWICDKPYGTLSDHEKFCIHDDLFNIIKLTH